MSVARTQVEKGATAAVFGLGTIGLAVIDALKEAGARRIIGVDTDEGKFERAEKWGATDLINPKKHEKPIQARASAGVPSVWPCAASLQAVGVGGRLLGSVEAPHASSAWTFLQNLM